MMLAKRIVNKMKSLLTEISFKKKLREGMKSD